MAEVGQGLVRFASIRSGGGVSAGGASTGISRLGAAGAPIIPSGGPFGTALPAQLPPSVGNTYYVDLSSANTGVDSRSSAVARTRSTPWATLAHALTVVGTEAGATIVLISNGEAVQLNAANSTNAVAIDLRGLLASATNPLTIRSETRYGVTLGSAGGPTGPFTFGVLAYKSAGFRIDGLTISTRGRDSGSGSGSTGVHLEWCNKVEIVNCLFQNVGGQGLLTRGQDQTAPGPTTDVWVLNCLFRQPLGSTYGVGVDATGGYFDTRGTHFIYTGQDNGGSDPAGTLSGDLRTVIANCIFSGTVPGFHVQCGPQSDTAYVVNNTFYNNRTPTSYAGDALCPFDNGDATRKTKNCLFYNNGFSSMRGSAIYGRAGGPEVGNVAEYNAAFNCQCLGAVNSGLGADPFPTLVQVGGNTIYTIGAHGNIQNSDPLFVNPSVGDFTPLQGSPWINGALASYCPVYDFNGATRVRPTIGALAA